LAAQQERGAALLEI